MAERVQIAAKEPEAKRENPASKVQKTDYSQTSGSPAQRILFLQRMIGNQAVQRLIKSGVLQAKLRIGQVGDICEQEADRVAEQVMQMPEPQVSKETRVSSRTRNNSIQRKCPGCIKGQSNKEEEEKVLQMKEISGSTSEVTPELESRISAVRGGGKPLPESARAFYEPRFGQDFSQVRVHSGEAAGQSARDVNAQAYTLGHDIVFGEGQYSTHTLAGQRLLAHELAHTLQQAKGSAAGAERISSLRDPAEQEADRAASDAIEGLPADVTTTASAQTLHLQPLPDVKLRPPPLTARLIGSEVLDEFALESYALTEYHKRRLAILAPTLLELLSEYPGGGVRITGHTDATGDEEFNDWLGQKRADAVRDFLIEAAVPATALVAVSSGERELRVKTDKPEPRNRRAEVRFETEPKGKLFPSLKLTLPGPPLEHEGIPAPERLCIIHPELKLCHPGPSPTLPHGQEVPTRCTSTNCSAVSVDRFDKQPADLRKVLAASFKDKDSATWFEQLDAERRMALTSIFNRLCSYGLWCHVRLILNIAAGEAPVLIADRIFKVPGRTPSVYFMSPDGYALIKALTSTGRFCMAYGAGASQHPGQTTLREISGSDSLHISIGPGDEFDAHIDRYSPVPEHPGSSFCSNEPSPAAVGHIGRELFPEKLRNILGIPGVEVFPEPAPPSPVPPGAVGSEPLPEVARITLRGPVKERQRQKSDVEPLPDDIERYLANEIPRRIRHNALVPPGAKRQLEAAVLAAEEAGPGEEEALVTAREAARERLESFAEDAHYFAQDMARRMDQARRSGRQDFAVLLGPIYGELMPDDRKYVLAHIRDIARIVRTLLAERAGGVHKVWVAFGESVIWDVDF